MKIRGNKIQDLAAEAAKTATIPLKDRTILDRMGVPKSLKPRDDFRTNNYFYKMFDFYGKQLVDAGAKRFGY